MPGDREVIANQVFIGCPWKDIRPKYEQAVADGEEYYPVNFVIIGRTTGQKAEDLWALIRRHVRESATCIFDAAGSNPNVALEFGFAEALGKHSVLARYERASARPKGEISIMSDLAGKVRTPWKSVPGLIRVLERELDSMAYVQKFEVVAKKHKFKKRKRKVAVAAVRLLNNKTRMSCADHMVALGNLFPKWKQVDLKAVVNILAKNELLVVKTGPKGGISVPRIGA